MTVRRFKLAKFAICLKATKTCMHAFSLQLPPSLRDTSLGEGGYFADTSLPEGDTVPRNVVKTEGANLHSRELKKINRRSTLRKKLKRSKHNL